MDTQPDPTPPVPTLKPDQQRPETKWDYFLKKVKGSRELQKAVGAQQPYSFQFRLKPDGSGARVYFLGVPFGKKEYTLMYCDVDGTVSDGVAGAPLTQHMLLADTSPSAVEFSVEEKMLRERQRITTMGITGYTLSERTGRVLFTQGGEICTCDDTDFSTAPISIHTVKTSTSGARLDAKMCPGRENLVAFINNNDLWVCNTNTGTEARLTYSASFLDAQTTISSGVAGYITQEEFDRYTGFWWQPVSGQTATESSTTYCILYEEVDEAKVDVIKIYGTSDGEATVEDMRYPRPGTNNSETTLKLCQFEVDQTAGSIDNIRVCRLDHSLRTVHPWMEYIVRVGWTYGGAYIWAQLMNRFQTRSAIVIIRPDGFLSEQQRASLPFSPATPLGDHIATFLEEQSSIWINVHDAASFLPSSSVSSIKLIWAAETTGYRHLYCYEGEPFSGMHSVSCEQLTSGDWEVTTDELSVDRVNELVYFTGRKHSVLEEHLYTVPYGAGKPRVVTRLTQPDASHSISISKNCGLVASSFSSVCTSTTINIYTTNPHSCSLSLKGSILPRVPLHPDYTPPELFHYTSRDGIEHHGMVFKPHNAVPGQKYPVFLYVYGGPHVQTVNNKNMAPRFIRQHLFASLGYAVVMIDGRGSSGRGKAFEGHLKNRMGTVEIADQVEGLEWLAANTDYIDLSRVAVNGWSYGGYLSLLALCQRPDFFKVSIAGAPVTDWKYYDTAYTERYMETPETNESGYTTGNVMSYVAGFPNEDGRLLVVHGLIDENVHYIHTRKLIDCLTTHCKPYRLQVHHNERHGIRNPETSHQYEAMVLSYLEKNL